MHGHHLSTNGRGFAYLVAVMDWYSRKVLSWRVSNVMDADFCIEALQARHYFCESLFWASQPKQAAKITWQLMPTAPQFVLRPCHCVK